MAKEPKTKPKREALNPGLPPIKEFEKIGETFEGRYLGTTAGFGKDIATLHFEEKDTGETFGIWATVTLIRAVPKMERGKTYEIIYESDVKTKGGYRVKDLKVYPSDSGGSF